MPARMWITAATASVDPIAKPEAWKRERGSQRVSKAPHPTKMAIPSPIRTVRGNRTKSRAVNTRFIAGEHNATPGWWQDLCGGQKCAFVAGEIESLANEFREDMVRRRIREKLGKTVAQGERDDEFGRQDTRANGT